MKKNVLALSIAAMIGGFAGAASASVIVGKGGAPATGGQLDTNVATTGAEVMSPSTATTFIQNEGGSGHILVTPYFTTQNENMTVVHVVNTDLTNGKALKVRFRGAANSDDIMDFTVFLSPGDVWTGAVTAAAGGKSRFTTADKSCTLPESVRTQGDDFITDNLSGNWSADVQANNTREGYIEILNMADIPKDAIYGTNHNAQSEMYKTIKHVGGVAPCDLTVLNKTLVDLDEQKAAALGFQTPTGGLTGDWYILNVAQTTTFSGASTAVVAAVPGTATTPATSARGNYVLFPQTGDEYVGGDNVTADPLKISRPASAKNVILDGPFLAPQNYDFPDLSTPYLMGYTADAGISAARQAYTLTNAVARGAAMNQYATDSIIAAKTDWVFSMPMRRYSVGANYNQKDYTANDYRLFNLGVNSTGMTTSVAPAATGVAQNTLDVDATGAKGDAANFFNGSNTTVDDKGNICITTASVAFFDREETMKTNGAAVSPGKAKALSFCGEVNVTSFKDDGAYSAVLGANVARTNVTETNGVFVNGWGLLDLTTKGTNVTGTIPVMGASFIKMTNSGGLANNFSGTYGITWPHRY